MRRRIWERSSPGQNHLPCVERGSALRGLVAWIPRITVDSRRRRDSAAQRNGSGLSVPFLTSVCLQGASLGCDRCSTTAPRSVACPEDFFGSVSDNKRRISECPG